MKKTDKVNHIEECPMCGCELNYHEGCEICINCGWSACEN